MRPHEGVQLLTKPSVIKPNQSAGSPNVAVCPLLHTGSSIITLRLFTKVLRLQHNYSAQLSSNYYTGNETARLSSNYCTGNELEQLSSIYDTGAETVEEMPTQAECTLPPKSLWSQPSTALQERQEDGTVAAVPSSNDGVSLPIGQKHVATAKHCLIT